MSTSHIPVPPGTDTLQRAIERSEPGQTLVLENGAKYGPVVLPPGRLDIAIECAGYPDRLAGTGRLRPGESLPVIASDSARAWPVCGSFRTAGVQFRGVHARNDRPSSDNSGAVTQLVSFGKNGDQVTDATSVDDLPRNVTFAHCHIDGGAGRRSRIGVLADAIDFTISKSLITGIVDVGHETQGIRYHNSPGPVNIEDCLIEATGENVLVGGASPTIPGVVVGKLRMARCDILKPYGWQSDAARLVVKNLVELKNCTDARIARNRMDGCWPDGQDGTAVLFTPREHNYGNRPAPQVTVGDVHFESNVIGNVSNGFLITNHDSNGDVRPTGEIRIQNNYVQTNGYGRMISSMGTTRLNQLNR